MILGEPPRTASEVQQFLAELKTLWQTKLTEPEKKAVREVLREKRLAEVVRQIQQAPSEEAAAVYEKELTEAIFGPQK